MAESDTISISIPEAKISLVKAQLKVIIRRFERYSQREPEDEYSDDRRAEFADNALFFKQICGQLP